MKEEARYWLETVAYDFETARAMLRTRRYLYVIFMCHLCLEKMLKGCIVEYADIFPPRTHNLNRLVELAGVELPEELGDFVSELAGQSVPTRYPKDLKRFTRAQAQDYLERTGRLLAWLRQKLTSGE